MGRDGLERHSTMTQQRKHKVSDNFLALDHAASSGNDCGLTPELLRNTVAATPLEIPIIVNPGWVSTLSAFERPIFVQCMPYPLQLVPNSHRRAFLPHSSIRTNFVVGLAAQVTLDSVEVSNEIDECLKVLEFAEKIGKRTIVMLSYANSSNLCLRQILNFHRIFQELNASYIKIPYFSGSSSEIDYLRHTPTKTVFAGGEKLDRHELMQRLRYVSEADIGGFAIGRNAFDGNEPGLFDDVVKLYSRV